MTYERELGNKLFYFITYMFLTRKRNSRNSEVLSSRKSANRCREKVTPLIATTRFVRHAARVSARVRSLARVCAWQEVSAGRVRLISRSWCGRSDTLRCASSRIEVKSRPRSRQAEPRKNRTTGRRVITSE